jgi:hypothetical protein
VTTTDIGILLILLCVLLWAILAAMHRHTVELNAIRSELEKLAKESGVPRRHAAADVDHGYAPQHAAARMRDQALESSRKT